VIWAAYEIGGTYSTHDRDEKFIHNFCLKSWIVSTTWVINRIWCFTTKMYFREIKCHFLDCILLARVRVKRSIFMTKVMKHVVQYMTDNVLRICTLKIWRCYSSSQSWILCQTRLHCQWDRPTDFLILEGEYIRNSTSARTRMPVVRNPSRLWLWSLWNYQLRFYKVYVTFFLYSIFFLFRNFHATEILVLYIVCLLSVPWLGL